MADQIPARLSRREGRRFGLTVGAAFLVLAGIVYWRGGVLAPRILGGLGGALAVAGLLVPGWLGPVHAAWMRLALAISKVTTPIFMGLVYFVALTPTGALRRWLGGNPLRHKPTETGLWIDRTKHDAGESSMTRQF